MEEGVQDVPILHKRRGRSGFYVSTQEEGHLVTYDLGPEGESFLTQILRAKEGDEVRSKDLALLIERGWAKPGRDPEADDETPAEPALAPSEEPIPPNPPRPSTRPRTSSKPTLIRRTRSREVALQVLYQSDQNAGLDPIEIDRFIARRLRDEQLQAFARAIVAGVQANQVRIDEMISDAAENWRIDRMAAIDRNIIRLGAYEMLYDPEVPPKVAINEALELAKRYSTAQSSRFVNGILDRLQSVDPNAPPSPPRAEPAPETDGTE